MNVSGTTTSAISDSNLMKKNIKDMNHDDFMNIIHEKIEDITTKLENGETQTSYQIGGSSFTIKEWDKLMEDFDKAEDELKEEMEEEIERLKEEDEELKRILEGKLEDEAKSDNIDDII